VNVLFEGEVEISNRHRSFSLRESPGTERSFVRLDVVVLKTGWSEELSLGEFFHSLALARNHPGNQNLFNARMARSSRLGIDNEPFFMKFPKLHSN
jgi:hypothetical protein